MWLNSGSINHVARLIESLLSKSYQQDFCQQVVNKIVSKYMKSIFYLNKNKENRDIFLWLFSQCCRRFAIHCPGDAVSWIRGQKEHLLNLIVSQHLWKELPESNCKQKKLLTQELVWNRRNQAASYNSAENCWVLESETIWLHLPTYYCS